MAWTRMWSRAEGAGTGVSPMSGLIAAPHCISASLGVSAPFSF